MNSTQDLDLREINEALLVSSVRQHELAAQAQKAELRYRRLFEAAQDGILILDIETLKITEANPFLMELLDYLHSDFVGRELWEIGLFIDKSANEAAAQELKQKGYLRYDDLPLKTKHGRVVEVEVVANAYRENGHDVIQCNIRDISQRRLMERELAKALTYADDIIATLREPFVVLDANLRVKTANRAFYDSFHVSQEETENCQVYDLGNGQWDIPALRKLLEEVLSHSRSVHDFEVEHAFPILGLKTMLLNARPFPPNSKHPELILLAVQDISDVRKQANELAAANRRKDEFLAMLGHELRNPLAPITNAVQILALQKNEGQLQQKARTIIERQVGQLTRLVDDLLQVSRITTGRIHLQLERVGLNSIVDRAVESVRPLLDQRQHQFSISLSPQPIWLNADSARLEQVIVNLLTNAAKYTPNRGEISLVIQQEGDQAVLRVKDTGVGIPPELLPHVFELFTQAERSLDRSQGGLGIGLSLVQQLVEMHGGKVAVQSTPGKGSEFVVHLPIMVPPLTPPSSMSSDIPEPIGQSLRVLVVDDNLDAVELFALLLEESGHEVRTAYDGPTAIEVACEFRPQVVLLDVGLPGLDGYEVARRLRQNSDLKGVVLVALTGYGRETDKVCSHDAGFDHHLVKPADFKQVQEILATVSQQAT